jgi:ribosomal protein RSM22 (predicted rRNA methylase)
MPLPQLLLSSLEKEISCIPIPKLHKAYAELSNQYRLNRKNIFDTLQNEEQRLSYVAARMPSTYETVYKVLNEIMDYASENIHSLLDIGAGPGTASWASCELFDSIRKITLLEQNPDMASLGKKLSNNHPTLKDATWIIQDATQSIPLIERADLVIASYSFNEIHEKNQEEFLRFMWEKTNKFLVIIDPGTPASFLSIHKARMWFIENQVNILSPCPHSLACPAFMNQDWCHFYARVQRTSLHKILKDGEKGYEDEKFSYLILSKGKPLKYEARIVRHPDIHSGHLKLNLCSEKGFETLIYSKKNGEKYKKARKSNWGDRWQISEISE